MKLPSQQRERRSQGFLLLEVVLALALFSTIAVAMTAALNQMAVASRSSRAEGRVLRALESVLAEVAHQPEMKPGKKSFPANAEGVAAEAVVERAELETRDKALLDHMFRITVDAWLDDGTGPFMKRHIETYVYAPDSPSL